MNYIYFSFNIKYLLQLLQNKKKKDKRLINSELTAKNFVTENVTTGKTTVTTVTTLLQLLRTCYNLKILTTSTISHFVTV